MNVKQQGVGMVDIHEACNPKNRKKKLTSLPRLRLLPVSDNAHLLIGCVIMCGSTLCLLASPDLSFREFTSNK